MTAAAVIAIGSAVPATAQVQRPYRGLFGGNAPPGSGHSLGASLGVGAGYDDNILAEQGGLGGGGTVTRAPVSGYLGILNGGLSYTANLPRFSFGASLSSSLRYFPGQDEEFIRGHSAGAGLNAPLGNRTTLSLSQSVFYMPYTLTAVLPTGLELGLGQIEAPPVDLAVAAEEFLSYSTNANVSHRFSRRWSGTIGYSYSGRDSSIYRVPFAQHGGQANMAYQLGQGLSLNLGYQRRTARFGGTNAGAAQDTIDAGVNYNKTLSFSRGTSISFGTGSSAIKTERGVTYRNQLTGNMRITHQMGRTWTAFAAYNRNLRFVDTLLEPVSADSVSGGVNGLLSRRVQFQSMIRASLGRIGNIRQSNNYDSYLASAGLAVAVSTNANFSLNYSYYHYQFGDTVILPIGVPSSVDRQSVRATLTLWAPVF